MRVAEASEGERAKAIRVADRVHRVERQDEERVGTLYLLERVHDLLLERTGRRPRQQVQDHLGIGARLEDRAVALHLPAKRLGVREIAVVGDRDRAPGGGGGDRLSVPEIRASGGRVAHVTDGAVARQAPQPLGAEHVGHPPHVLLGVEVGAVGGRDARRLLAAMLERVEAEVRDVAGLRMVPDAEEPALVVESCRHARWRSNPLLHACSSRPSIHVQRPCRARPGSPDASPPVVADPAPRDRRLRHQRLELPRAPRLDRHDDAATALAEEQSGRRAPPAGSVASHPTGSRPVTQLSASATATPPSEQSCAAVDQPRRHARRARRAAPGAPSRGRAAPAVPRDVRAGSRGTRCRRGSLRPGPGAPRDGPAP